MDICLARGLDISTPSVIPERASGSKLAAGQALLADNVLQTCASIPELTGYLLPVWTQNSKFQGRLAGV